MYHSSLLSPLPFKAFEQYIEPSMVHADIVVPRGEQYLCVERTRTSVAVSPVANMYVCMYVRMYVCMWLWVCVLARTLNKF